MTSSHPSPQGPRRGRMRERRGRGKRGPLTLAGPLAPAGTPLPLSRREEFDQVVLDAVDRLRPRWESHLASLEIAVEDAPDVGPGWTGSEVQMVIVVPADPGGVSRVVVYRMPIVTRAPSGDPLADLVLSELVEELAVLWHEDPDDVDPRGDL
ncbi:metallopeptidase family protein [Solicola sp. PLA-1-18]|uniref:metallopeptidase family protein n=1 Tax=Solicola sp. PLA-1-18 TaxID=3380532 RepID=UPI003B7FADCE